MRCTSLLVARVLALAAALSVAACSGQSHDSAAIFSRSGYEQAEAQARTDKKLLLVDATASWCPPCQAMERETWPDSKVVAWVTANAIAVQVDVDKEPELAGRLKIEAMPTLILFKDGEERARQTGYLDAAGLLAWLEDSK